MSLAWRVCVAPALHSSLGAGAETGGVATEGQ
jgi:hypothetical protein